VIKGTIRPQISRFSFVKILSFSTKVGARSNNFALFSKVIYIKIRNWDLQPHVDIFFEVY